MRTNNANGTSTWVTESATPNSLYTPLWSYDFESQTTSGWTGSIYNSCSGGANFTNNSTYWYLDSGNDGTRLCYSSSSARKTETITSDAPVVIYVDAEVLFAPTNKQAAIGAAGVERIEIPVLSRSAIRIGTTASPLSLSQISVYAASWWGGWSTITQGRVNVYGVYIGLASDEALMEQYLENKGLSIY